jgi:hypothetical protein
MIPDSQPEDYCRHIEAYLCQKNDGHLIRIVGPSFELVSRWEAEGVPLKVAYSGIDRYFERYYRKGPRRRPVRIDFCEADVLDVFDEWRRAIGLSASPADASGAAVVDTAPARRPGSSLPAHLERVLMTLTNARATGKLGPEADALLDRVADELERARASAHGVRGDARRALLERLAALDTELIEAMGQALPAPERGRVEREAEQELEAFRAAMAADAYQRARNAAVARLLRERFALPTITFD